MSLSSLHLDAFLAVARTGNFSKAAKAVHVTQSALSQRIQNLEKELGQHLLIREAGGASLTPAGLKFLRYCETREKWEAEMLFDLKGGDEKALGGSLRVAGFSSVVRSVVMPALADLVRDHSEIHLEVMTREMSALPNLLRTVEAEFVLLNKKIDRPGVEHHLLGYEDNVLVESPREKKRPKSYLDHDSDDDTTQDFFGVQRGKTPKLQRSFLDEIYGILDGVRLGLGRAVVPRHLLKDYTDLIIVGGYVPMPTPVFLNYYRQSHYTRLHQAARQALIARCSALLLAPSPSR